MRVQQLNDWIVEIKVSWYENASGNGEKKEQW